MIVRQIWISFEIRVQKKLHISMSYSNSLVWVCSRIGGLKKNLDKVLPLVTFDQISEDKLKNIESHVNGSSKYDQPQVLIVDNSIIPRLINETKIPFKFIQVSFLPLTSHLMFILLFRKVTYVKFFHLFNLTRLFSGYSSI